MITNIVTLSITIGLIVSLIFSEFFGIAAGGMVVPGYIALFLNKPVVLALTLFVSFLTYFIVHSLSSFMIIYGRRRTVLMILVGFILGWFIRGIGTVPIGTTLSIDLNVVGYIIPGLVAIWIDRQGAIETYSALITSSVIVRLVLLLVVGAEVL